MFFEKFDCDLDPQGSKVKGRKKFTPWVTRAKFQTPNGAISPSSYLHVSPRKYLSERVDTGIERAYTGGQRRQQREASR